MDENPEAPKRDEADQQGNNGDTQPETVDKQPEAGILKKPKSNAPLWIGAGFLGAAVAFLMALVMISIIYPNTKISHDTKFYIVAIMALSMAAGVAVLGGSAVADGTIKVPGLFKGHSVRFGLAGGVVVFAAVMLLSKYVYLDEHLPKTTSFGDFDRYVSEYVLTYQPKQISLDRAFFATNMEVIDSFDTPIAYSDFLTVFFERNPEQETELISLVGFYESVLACGQAQNVNCSAEEVEKYFGENVSGFTNSYGPYLEKLASARYAGQFPQLMEKING